MMGSTLNLGCIWSVCMYGMLTAWIWYARLHAQAGELVDSSPGFDSGHSARSLCERPAPCIWSIEHPLDSPCRETNDTTHITRFAPMDAVSIPDYWLLYDWLSKPSLLVYSLTQTHTHTRSVIQFSHFLYIRTHPHTILHTQVFALYVTIYRQ